MKATLLFHSKEAYRDGFVEMVIWRVPQPVSASEHTYKYRLAYVVHGKRVVGYDNERGRGDHRHLGKREMPYRFVGPQQLIADFMDDVKGSAK
jgi:hypothetical protein